MKTPYWAIFRFDTYSGTWEEEHEFEATDTRQYRLEIIANYRQSSSDSFKLQRVFPKMLKITLEGPQASGKTLMHEVIKAHMAEVTAKTGHGIEVVERNPEQAGHESRQYPRGEIPSFKVYRFKPSGKYDMEFDLFAPDTKTMNEVSKLLRETKKMPAGYSMVIAAPNNQIAEDFFYPVEVK